MSERLIEIRQTELTPTLRALSDAGGLVDDATWIRQGNNASLLVKFIHGQRRPAIKNEFEISVTETLRRLRQANREQCWGIEEGVIAALAETAPPWPSGRRAFRSLRIRWGGGDGGMTRTFERHAARIERVFGPKFRRWELLRSDPGHLSLVAGNRTHHRPTVGWVTFDLDENRQRDSVEAVRGPASLADEGLAFAWLFPEYVEKIEYEENPGIILAGYELWVPEGDGRSRRQAPLVYRDLYSGQVFLYASWLSNDHSGFSVPSSRGCRP